MRRLRLVPILIVIGSAAVIATGVWHRQLDPPRTISTGTFTLDDKRGTSLMFPKRVVAVAGFEKTEIQLPNGTWIDCRSDCGQAVRDEHIDSWERQQQRR